MCNAFAHKDDGNACEEFENTIGDHSAAHRDLNRTPVDEWLAEVAHCNDYLKNFGSAHTSYFRFPMLHQGVTLEKRLLP